MCAFKDGKAVAETNQGLVGHPASKDHRARARCGVPADRGASEPTVFEGAVKMRPNIQGAFARKRYSWSEAVEQPVPTGAEELCESMADAEAVTNNEGFRASLAQLFRDDGWGVHYETGNLWRPSRSSNGKGVPIGRNQTGGGALEERQMEESGGPAGRSHGG